MNDKQTGDRITLLTERFFNSAISLLAVLFLSFAGCGGTDTSSGTTTSLQPIEELRYPNDYTQYEDTEVLDGSSGHLVVARGRVLTPAGTPSPRTLVTLDQSFPGTNRCLFTRSDAEGKYVVHGQQRYDSAHVIWAATADGKLGASWMNTRTWEPEPVDIQLRDGHTVLHVRDVNCQAVANATVTVYMSGIDDMSWIVPPNIRQLLTRKTDEQGTVSYPSRLGDHDLGFDVRAAGHRPLARDFYSGLRPELTKLFVLSVDPDATDACARRFVQELFPDSADPSVLDVGRPDHF